MFEMNSLSHISLTVASIGGYGLGVKGIEGIKG